ncbi:MAG TPA: hypothetical protein VFO53_05965 [Casimicrobiaceae bacterium]|nr:hypothetical protein [Casimicrobiaceae bacterium]
MQARDRTRHFITMRKGNAMLSFHMLRPPSAPLAARCGVRTQCLAIIALAAAFPIAAYAAHTEGATQAPEDSLLIKMLNAQIHALDGYERCLEGEGLPAPCEPPRPLQLPARELTADRGAHRDALIGSAERSLKEAELHAIRTHARCMKTRQSGTCGPAP